MTTGQPAIVLRAVLKTLLSILMGMIVSFAAESAWAETGQDIDASVYACLTVSTIRSRAEGRWSLWPKGCW
jgi:hypothetical protein